MLSLSAFSATPSRKNILVHQFAENTLDMDGWLIFQYTDIKK